MTRAGTRPLDSLLTDVAILDAVGDTSVAVSGVAHDTADVRPGALFCCLRGSRRDGHDLAPGAADAGAAAFLVERRLDVARPQVVVTDSRVAMAPVAAAFHDHPSRSMDVIGVTGTNGKTTVCHLVRSILQASGRATGILGTLSGARTTPEAPALQASLAAFRDDGCAAVAMEVSSHGLVQHRVDATWFAVAVFTNLSPDHLDFHGTMEAYFEAKAMLFTPDRCAVAVVNAADPAGRAIAERAASAGVDVRTYDPDAVGAVADGVGASRFAWRGEDVRLPLGGRFNVANALAAATAAEALGVDAATVAAGLGRAEPVRGRFEPVVAGQPFGVVVDFAHTPGALEEVLRTAREATSGRLIVVFGCGGDRDRAKRPVMGRMATDLADRAILTSDNPRSEDPLAILDEVRRGVVRPEVLVVEPDRRAAIRQAIAGATDGDLVVIAGKGHEQGQEIAGQVTHFDDREEALAALAGAGFGDAR